jgi:hypothetical protein
MNRILPEHRITNSQLTEYSIDKLRSEKLCSNYPAVLAEISEGSKIIYPIAINPTIN